MRKYLLTLLLIIPTFAFAQNIKLANPAGGMGNTAWDFIHTIITILKWFVIPAIAIMIIFAGFKMATAGGDTKQITEGKKILIGAIIGSIVLFSADIIVNIVRHTGESLLN